MACRRMEGPKLEIHSFLTWAIAVSLTPQRLQRYKLRYKFSRRMGGRAQRSGLEIENIDFC